MMDLDDLKADWAQRDLALAAAIRNHGNLMHCIQIDRQLDMRRRAKILGDIGFAVQVAIWLGILALFGGFLGKHFGEWKFFVPAVLLHLWTIAMGVIAFRQHLALRAIDFGRPPAEVQQSLATLRLQRALTVKWGLLTGQLLWFIPFAIVLSRGLLRLDLYTASPFLPTFMAIAILAGLLFIPIALLAGRLIGPKLAEPSFSRKVIDAITGRDLAPAQAMAQRIAEFGKRVEDSSPLEKS